MDGLLTAVVQVVHVLVVFVDAFDVAHCQHCVAALAAQPNLRAASIHYLTGQLHAPIDEHERKRCQFGKYKRVYFCSNCAPRASSTSNYSNVSQQRGRKSDERSKVLASPSDKSSVTDEENSTTTAQAGLFFDAADARQAAGGQRLRPPRPSIRVSSASTARTTTRILDKVLHQYKCLKLKFICV